jgi:hypothetical protein
MNFRWPWVSRAAYELLQRELADTQAERKDLMERLLVRRALEDTDTLPVKEEQSKERVKGSTPFATIGQRFDKTTDKARYKIKLV